MIQICARPAAEPVVCGEGMYTMEFKLGSGNYIPLMKVRARTGALAEEKLMFVFKHELSGKILDFDIRKFKNEEGKDDASDKEARPGDPEKDSRGK